MSDHDLSPESPRSTDDSTLEEASGGAARDLLPPPEALQGVTPPPERRHRINHAPNASRPRGAGNAIRPGGSRPVRPTAARQNPENGIKNLAAGTDTTSQKKDVAPRGKFRTTLPWVLLAVFCLGTFGNLTVDSEESKAENFPAEVFNAEKASSDRTQDFKRAAHGKMWSDLVDSVKQQEKDGPVHVYTNVANTLTQDNHAELSEWELKQGRAALGAADSICKAAQISFKSTNGTPPVIVYDRDETIMASNLLWGVEDANCRRVPVPHD